MSHLGIHMFLAKTSVAARWPKLRECLLNKFSWFLFAMSKRKKHWDAWTSEEDLAADGQPSIQASTEDALIRPSIVLVIKAINNTSGLVVPVGAEIEQNVMRRCHERGNVVGHHIIHGLLYVKMATEKQATRISSRVADVHILGGRFALAVTQISPTLLASELCPPGERRLPEQRGRSWKSAKGGVRHRARNRTS